MFQLNFTGVEGNKKCDAGAPEAPGAAAVKDAEHCEKRRSAENGRL